MNTSAVPAADFTDHHAFLPSRAVERLERDRVVLGEIVVRPVDGHDLLHLLPPARRAVHARLRIALLEGGRVEAVEPVRDHDRRDLAPRVDALHRGVVERDGVVYDEGPVGAPGERHHALERHPFEVTLDAPQVLAELLDRSVGEDLPGLVRLGHARTIAARAAS
ncbi:MAG: hypothetical protein QM820_57810 [Minicystis sp.]